MWIVYSRSRLRYLICLEVINANTESSTVPVAVSNAASQATILTGNAKISSWMQGRTYTSASGEATQGSQTAVTKPATLLNSAGNVFTRSKPQYETVPVASFLSAKAAGAKGDGVTDDTAAIQALFNSATASDVVYFDHGAYVITSTVKVPKDIRITGEIWPLIMAKGTAFADQANPTPVFQVGQVGDTGSVEMSDLIFETLGPAPGAVLVEWNVAETSQGSSGMWDVHSEYSPSRYFFFCIVLGAVRRDPPPKTCPYPFSESFRLFERSGSRILVS